MLFLVCDCGYLTQHPHALDSPLGILQSTLSLGTAKQPCWCLLLETLLLLCLLDHEFWSLTGLNSDSDCSWLCGPEQLTKPL